MNKAIRFKLFLMMVLEFFIWGAWFPLIFGYLPSLGFSASEPPQILAPLIPKAVSFFFSEQSLILNAFPAAAIVGMFFSNQFADRNFAAEKFLAASHLIGGASMLSLVWVQAFWPFFFLMLVHCLLYVPTKAYEIKTGETEDSSFPRDTCISKGLDYDFNAPPTKGTDFSDEDLPAICPRLWERFAS